MKKKDIKMHQLQKKILEIIITEIISSSGNYDVPDNGRQYKGKEM
jgi:hypothetical protein